MRIANKVHILILDGNIFDKFSYEHVWPFNNVTDLLFLVLFSEFSLLITPLEITFMQCDVFFYSMYGNVLRKLINVSYHENLLNTHVEYM